MRYLLLIYTPERADDESTPAEEEAVLEAYFAYSRAARDAGVMVGGEALQSATTATTVSVREDQTLTSDGPFIETKEQLGGYYLLECPNLDDAIEWATKIPGAKYGTIEIRPLVDFD